MQVLQSKCLRFATDAPWYVSNRQIHEDLGVPLFAYHIGALTASFDSKIADAGSPVLRQLADTYAERGVIPSPDAKAKGGRGPQASRDRRPRRPSRLNESRCALLRWAPFGYPDWGFPWFFPVVRQMPGYTMQIRGTACICPTPLVAAASPKPLLTFSVRHLYSVYVPRVGILSATAL
jgi:hypothetical protein